jgi:hypothetical protein
MKPAEGNASVESDYRVPGIWSVSLAVARVGFAEILRDRVLLNIAVLTVLMILASVITAQITPSVTARVLTDFSWGALLVSCFAIALTQGASVVGREIERRTILVALARPIHRAQWLVGKFLGVAAVVTLNGMLLFLVSCALVYGMLGSDGSLSPFSTRLAASTLLLVQSWVIAAVALFFSTFTTTSLSVVLTVGVYLIGASSSQIRWLAGQSEGPARWLLEGVATLIPNFELFHLSHSLTYGLPVEVMTVVSRFGYGLLWCVIPVLAGGYLLQKRDL